KAPIAIDIIYGKSPSTAFGIGKTNIPPCGTANFTLNNIVNAPVTAEPAINDGITLNGSAAANGIAPSVIKDIPNTNAAFPASLSSLVNLFLAIKVAIPIPNGGVIPAAITAAITDEDCPAAIVLTPKA